MLNLRWQDRQLRRSARSTTTLKPEYRGLIPTLHDRLVREVNVEMLARMEEEDARFETRTVLMSWLEAQTAPSALEKQRICDDVMDEFFGMGPLEPLLEDPAVSVILVNGASQIYVERNGRLQLTGATFHDDQHLTLTMDRIAQRFTRWLSEETPMFEQWLPDGSYVQAVIPPLATNGGLLSIRRVVEPLLLHDLVEQKALTPGMMTLLESAVRARLNIVVTGGGRAGKTTLLNALASLVEPRELVVSIESRPELRLTHPRVVRLETRPPNLGGRNAVGQRELLVNALRLRPDRIICGEVLGDEALELLQAMHTGCDGLLTTVQALDARDAVNRLEAMVAIADHETPPAGLRHLVSSAVDLFVLVARLPDGSRRVTGITEVDGMNDGGIVLRDLFNFQTLGSSPDGTVVGRFTGPGRRPKCDDKLRAAGICLTEDLLTEVVDV